MLFQKVVKSSSSKASVVFVAFQTVFMTMTHFFISFMYIFVLNQYKYKSHTNYNHQSNFPWDFISHLLNLFKNTLTRPETRDGKKFLFCDLIIHHYHFVHISNTTLIFTLNKPKLNMLHHHPSRILCISTCYAIYCRCLCTQFTEVN